MAKAILQKIPATLRDAPARLFALLLERPRVAAGILALLFVSLAVAAAGIVKPREIDFLNPLSAFSSSDFDDYFQASKTFLKGEDPYRLGQINDLFNMAQGAQGGLDLSDPFKLAAALEKLKGVGTYLYPPFTAFLLTPLTGLEYEIAAAIFQTASLAALAFFLYCIFRLHRRSIALNASRASDASGDYNPAGDGPFWLAALAAVLLLYRFLDGNAGNGNIGYFLILLCGGGLLLIFRGSFALEFAGGVLLGLATIMKITPGFLGLVLIGGRKFVAILGMGAGALLALLAPASVLGWQRNLDLFWNWYQLIVQTFSQMSFVRPWMNNQSISGAIGKLFIPASDLKQAAYGLPLGDVSDQATTAIFAQGVKLANLSLVVLGLIVAVVVALRFRRSGAVARETSGQGGSPGASLSISEMFPPSILRLMVLAILISLLAAGVSWYHAYSILLIPVVLRLYQHWSGAAPLSPGRADPLDGAWLALFGFFGIFQSLLPKGGREALAMYSVFACLCFGMTLWLAARLILDRSLSRKAGAAAGAEASRGGGR
ncbi:MAG: DUF2029 domain-containing protein [bacterium]|nr:DUF2029 domain-containing protein [bacterium]